MGGRVTHIDGIHMKARHVVWMDSHQSLRLLRYCPDLPVRCRLFRTGSDCIHCTLGRLAQFPISRIFSRSDCAPYRADISNHLYVPSQYGSAY